MGEYLLFMIALNRTINITGRASLMSASGGVSMKKFGFILVILALALVFGLVFVGCGGDVDDELNGSWVNPGGQAVYTFDNGNFTYKTYGVDNERGIYTTAAGVLTMTTTGVYFSEEDAAQFNDTAGWKTKSLLTEIFRRNGYPDDEINEYLATLTSSRPYTVTGNTLTMGGVVYTRQ